MTSFTIISINDERARFKDVIRERVNFQEIEMDAVDGVRVDFYTEFDIRGLVHGNRHGGFGWDNAKRGELGVWLSNYDRWLRAGTMTEPLIVFEDDAIPNPFFNLMLEDLLIDLPDDWDVLTLWVPPNQHIDYFYDVWYDEHGHPAFNGLIKDRESYYHIGSNKIAKTYQGYGMVANMYSPEGGRKLVEIAQQRGVDNPVDCWLFEEMHKGNINGYAPRPDYTHIVEYDWTVPSHVQQTERAL